jgi:2-polyprenyl-6-hydroxyphenyl methylase/3-demethylubiquinone-9 3-methyltransferase
MTKTMATCLWFNGQAEQAANFYAATFPGASLGHVQRAPGDYPGGKVGDVVVVEFTLMGQHFLALNGRRDNGFNDAVSFQVFTDDQAETDRYWDALTSEGGAESMCGWCTDRFGVSWQITPRALTAAISHPDKAASKRAFEAMMTMKKIDIGTIQAAVAG